MRKTTPAIERVMARVEMIPIAGCWLFTGALNEAGYGIVGVGGRGGGNDRAHRITYRHFVGEIPNGLFVCHRCDTPSCCNPAHLFLGTNAENASDMRTKGRACYPTPQLGESNVNAVLTSERAAEIKRELARGRYRGQCADLARRYGVSLNVVFRVATGKTWRHA